MGYFSNATEQGIYENEYCGKCIHFDYSDGCLVMNAHWIGNYDQCTNKEVERVLACLIPRAKGTQDFPPHNDQCKMWTEK